MHLRPVLLPVEPQRVAGVQPDHDFALRVLDGMLVKKEDLQQIIVKTSSYDTKLPDLDIESKLNLINWRNDKIILFVGRIISSKGLQSIIAALPFIFELYPSARLL